MSQADEIQKFKSLLDSGAITQEEYAEAKKKILASINSDGADASTSKAKTGTDDFTEQQQSPVKVCPRCGSTDIDDFGFCKKCGQDVNYTVQPYETEGQIKQETNSQNPSHDNPNDDRITCWNCGSTDIGEDGYCNKCGARVITKINATESTEGSEKDVSTGSNGTDEVLPKAMVIVAIMFDLLGLIVGINGAVAGGIILGLIGLIIGQINKRHYFSKFNTIAVDLGLIVIIVSILSGIIHAALNNTGTSDDSSSQASALDDASSNANDDSSNNMTMGTRIYSAADFVTLQITDNVIIDIPSQLYWDKPVNTDNSNGTETYTLVESDDGESPTEAIMLLSTNLDGSDLNLKDHEDEITSVWTEQGLTAGEVSYDEINGLQHATHSISGDDRKGRIDYFVNEDNNIAAVGYLYWNTVKERKVTDDIYNSLVKSVRVIDKDDLEYDKTLMLLSSDGIEDVKEAINSCNTVAEHKVDPYKKVDAQTMLDALGDNALQASRTYSGKQLAITGKLDDVDSSGDYFTMVGTNEYAIINIHVDISSNSDIANKVAGLSKGTTITVKGTVTNVDNLFGYTVDVDSLEKGSGSSTTEKKETVHKLKEADWSKLNDYSMHELGKDFVFLMPDTWNNLAQIYENTGDDKSDLYIVPFKLGEGNQELFSTNLKNLKDLNSNVAIVSAYEDNSTLGADFNTFNSNVQNKFKKLGDVTVQHQELNGHRIINIKITKDNYIFEYFNIETSDTTKVDLIYWNGLDENTSGRVDKFETCARSIIDSNSEKAKAKAESDATKADYQEDSNILIGKPVSQDENVATIKITDDIVADIPIKWQDCENMSGSDGSRDSYAIFLNLTEDKQSWNEEVLFATYPIKKGYDLKKNEYNLLKDDFGANNVTLEGTIDYDEINGFQHGRYNDLVLDGTYKGLRDIVIIPDENVMIRFTLWYNPDVIKDPSDDISQFKNIVYSLKKTNSSNSEPKTGDIEGFEASAKEYLDQLYKGEYTLETNSAGSLIKITSDKLSKDAADAVNGKDAGAWKKDVSNADDLAKKLYAAVTKYISSDAELALNYLNSQDSEYPVLLRYNNAEKAFDLAEDSSSSSEGTSTAKADETKDKKTTFIADAKQKVYDDFSVDSDNCTVQVDGNNATVSFWIMGLQTTADQALTGDSDFNSLWNSWLGDVYDTYCELDNMLKSDISSNGNVTVKVLSDTDQSTILMEFGPATLYDYVSAYD